MCLLWELLYIQNVTRRNWLRYLKCGTYSYHSALLSYWPVNQMQFTYPSDKQPFHYFSSDGRCSSLSLGLTFFWLKECVSAFAFYSWSFFSSSSNPFLYNFSPFSLLLLFFCHSCNLWGCAWLFQDVSAASLPPSLSFFVTFTALNAQDVGLFHVITYFVAFLW